MCEYEKAHVKKDEIIKLGSATINIDEFQEGYLNMVEERQKKIIKTILDFIPEGFDESLELSNLLNNRNDEELYFDTKHYLFYYNGKVFTLNGCHSQGFLICLDKFPMGNDLCKIYIDRYAKNLKNLIHELRKIVDEK